MQETCYNERTYMMSDNSITWKFLNPPPQKPCIVSPCSYLQIIHLLTLYTHSSTSDMPGNKAEKIIFLKSFQYCHKIVLNTFKWFKMRPFQGVFVSETWKRYTGTNHVNMTVMMQNPLVQPKTWSLLMMELPLMVQN